MWFMQQQVYCSNMAKVQEWPSDKKKKKHSIILQKMASNYV